MWDQSRGDSLAVSQCVLGTIHNPENELGLYTPQGKAKVSCFKCPGGSGIPNMVKLDVIPSR